MTNNVSETFQSQPASLAQLGLAGKFPRFIIVAIQSFTPWNLERFGATWLLDRGKTVHLVDLSLLVWGQLGHGTDRPDIASSVFRPVNWEDCEQFIAKYAHDSLWILCLYPRQAPPIFHLLSKYQVRTLYFEFSRLPRYRDFSGSLRRLIRSLARSPMRALGKVLKRAKPEQQFHLDYLVMGGKACELKPPAWVKKAEVTVPCHAYDYVTWNTTPAHSHGGPYIVFLDQAYPDHIDTKQLMMTNPFPREWYYSNMRDFLKQVTTTYRLPVIVALHPRALANGDNPYAPFKAFMGHTASLVKGSGMVIAHDSIAISFAVLGRKPLLLVKLAEMDQWQAGGLTDCLARELDAPVVSLEARALPSIEQLVVNESKYRLYEMMYIRHPSCNGVHVWDRIFSAQADCTSYTLPT